MAVRYEWRTIRFEGPSADDATRAFGLWFGYGEEEFSLTKQKIRRQSDGSLHMFLSHHPRAKSHEIYVTALVEVAVEDLP